MGGHRQQLMTKRLRVARVMSLIGLGAGYAFLVVGVVGKAGWIILRPQATMLSAGGLTTVMFFAMGLSYAVTQPVWWPGQPTKNLDLFAFMRIPRWAGVAGGVLFALSWIVGIDSWRRISGMPYEDGPAGCPWYINYEGVRTCVTEAEFERAMAHLLGVPMAMATGFLAMAFLITAGAVWGRLRSQES